MFTFHRDAANRGNVGVDVFRMENRHLAEKLHHTTIDVHIH